jgi:phage tail sheath protein FI
MASTYKTPGVYVEEISKFPPSVAAVETAIPAFIGYTLKAEKNGEDLTRVPTKIDSFLEFESFFGGAPSREIVVRLNTANQFIKTERKNNKKPFLLYDSLRLFYDNGGGVCYIISVGNFNNTPEIGDGTKGILSGLKAIEKYDEPTLIVSPDAVNLDSDLYTFQQQALNQCNKLQDRFLICDLLRSDEKKAGETFDDRVTQFRDNIGINYLKYGAAYAPWLKASLPAGLRFRDIVFAYESDPNPTEASSLSLLTAMTNNPALLQLIYDLDNAIKTVNAIQGSLIPGAGLVATGIKDLDAQFKKLQTGFMGVYNITANNTYAAFEPTLKAIFEKIRDVILAVKTISDGLPAIVGTLLVPSATQTIEFKLQKEIDNLKTSAKAIFVTLVTYHREFLVKSGGVNNLLVAGAPLNDVISFLGFPNPPALTDVPNDPLVQQQFRLLAAKKAMLDALSGIATAAVPNTANAANTAVNGAIPPTNTIKTAVDAIITTAKAGPPANVAAVLAAINAVVAANSTEKLMLAIAASYVDEEIKSGITVLADLAPSFPDSIGNLLFQDLQNAKQAANRAAAVVAPPATKASVAASVAFTVVLPREHSLMAANGAINLSFGITSVYQSVNNAANTYETIFDQSILQSFGAYKTLVTKAGQDIMVLPPSAAIAGVYASVDANRGVFKAPANASLASVLGPHLTLNTLEQEPLNVDPNAGKSINAIRAFSGKGTLVWGSRTMAGNDNEWRYVPVRRFFNFAEESIKKATEPFVFEPNDANTWVKVRAMIENFLTVQWRTGALAGAKPDEAFYVRVGLGQTMTALDILEGRMIVEIGMAVVRPAEFIILKFSHKMQES